MIDYLKHVISESKTGQIPYDDYMNIVLYHPDFGYYMKQKEKIGKGGDFITTSNISNVFGILFADVFLKLFSKVELKPHLCEIGGGNGRFAKAILDQVHSKDPDLYDRLTYTLIESSPYHQSLQQSILETHRGIEQFQSVEDMQKTYPEFNGIIFSNELYDAFPVSVIEKHNNELYEVMVALDNEGKLVERYIPLSNKAILTYLEEQNISLKEKQRFEVPLAMQEHIEKLGIWLNKGIVITVDYGYTNEEWKLPEHSKGSLRGYYKHQLVESALEHPGEMDLTTHIHFDSLVTAGEKSGLNYVTKLRQDRFLLAAGILDYLQEHHDTNPFSEKSKQNRALRSLIMEGSMSAAFHVVIQEKNISIAWDEILTSW
ncbi:SAM-dependent methyltransferase [Bacillus luteolus]|uniref:SAM-dependent methyltransferase n=1 Tax=Litchfieldia luteola TaxID=682179 RepID=A0ABR9QHI4_9BACI|nr:SAM-dependent methyltransferase [Cytobacillus luteolus]MBE4907958.1 SAM-dependent methyltransferase [Cytobacillus luteolus]MBP1942738.1 SAM-dependent MidA family methyltransferase [Cytobacillus luteolus]